MQVRGLPVLSYDEAAAGGFGTDVVGVIRLGQRAIAVPGALEP